MQVRVQHRDVGGAVERRRPDDALVEHARERVDVGARIDVLPSICSGAQYSIVPTKLPVRVRPVRASSFTTPKSERYARSSAPTRMFAGFTSRWTSPRACAASSADAIWPRMRERAPQRQPALADEQRLEVAALDAGHRDVEEAVVLAGVVDRDDAGMVERGGELRLAQEPLAEVGLAERATSSFSAAGRPSRTCSAR